jgi:hypothetical protein
MWRALSGCSARYFRAASMDRPMWLLVVISDSLPPGR